MPASYVEVCSIYFPEIQAYATGAGYDYAELRSATNAELPTQAVLDPLRLAAERDQIWRLIQVERDRRKYNGVKVGANWFHSDDPSRIQQIGLVMMGASLPAIQWKTLSGGFVTMTPALAMGIFQSIAGQDVAIFARAELHRYNMMQASNPSTYDFSTNWPLTYGE